jgi:exopolysaccharide biosynthesis polyprenyl glycosylphosphotransferase
VLRTAIIGGAASAASLDRELRLARVRDHVVVGRIALDEDDHDGGDAIPVLGPLGRMSDVVHRHRLDLLVVTGEVSRVVVFDELAHSWVGHRARVWELAGLCETLFGHVPTAEIDATWFGYVLHPRYRESSETVKRAVDVVGSLLGIVLLAPVLLLAAALVRQDGGPALFRQVRIGREGKPFTLLKLRTMRETPAGAARWSGPDDERVTRVGALLRRTHLDELPQLLNVLRGEMSLVGPRPEVPQFVERLEETLPFYGRRHLVKPGLTGWAQVRVGYAGSDLGSAWKLCHDLYYVKHRSLALDLMILGETARMLFVEPHAAALPVSAWAGRRPVLEPAAPEPQRSREPAL